MRAFEGRISREVGHIVAVLSADAKEMRQRFRRDPFRNPDWRRCRVFAPREPVEPVADSRVCRFHGLAGEYRRDALFYQAGATVDRQSRPRARGDRRLEADREILDLMRCDPKIQVTGTVLDVRPFLGVRQSPSSPAHRWRHALENLRGHGGPHTLASTSIGAEGLGVISPDYFRVADTAEAFAKACVTLLDDERAARKWPRRPGSSYLRGIAGKTWALLRLHLESPGVSMRRLK